jgi:hypothetical protein
VRVVRPLPLLRSLWAVAAVGIVLTVTPQGQAQEPIVRLPPIYFAPAAARSNAPTAIPGSSTALRPELAEQFSIPGSAVTLVASNRRQRSPLDDANEVYNPAISLEALDRRQPSAQVGQGDAGGSGDSDDDDSWPNISEPGPDMGDFPNSAFTVPKGGVQVEFSPVTLLKADRQNPAAYATPFLLRFGLTDNVEFRLLGFGLISAGGPSPTTGVAPPKLDMKVHLWNARKQWLLPAASLEVYLTTTWGSPQFSSGWQPSVNMNFDLPITKKLNLEWTVGYGGVQQAININTGEVFVPRFGFVVPGIHRELDLNFDQFSASWAFEYEVSERLAIFFHGAHNGALLLNLGAGDIIGQGIFWKFNKRLLAFGSINEGVTPNLPPVAAQIGFAYAL